MPNRTFKIEEGESSHKNRRTIEDEGRLRFLTDFNIGDSNFTIEKALEKIQSFSELEEVGSLKVWNCLMASNQTVRWFFAVFCEDEERNQILID